MAGDDSEPLVKLGCRESQCISVADGQVVASTVLSETVAVVVKMRLAVVFFLTIGWYCKWSSGGN